MSNEFDELRAALKQRRATLGYTLSEVAERMRCAPSTVGQMENGYPVRPNDEVLRRWVHALHGELTFTAMLSFEHDPRPTRTFDLTPETRSPKP